ncbi:MAG: hypothetical protein QXN37_01740 [Candidatus Anstonellaceae archaeon]
MRYAIFAVAIIALILILQIGGQQKETRKQEALPGFAFYGAEIVDWGGGQRIVLAHIMQEEGDSWIECKDRPFPNKFVVLSSNPLPGINKDLAQAVRRQLERCGISALFAYPQDAAKMENAIVISASGAIPLELYEANQSKVVSIIALEGKAIDQYGKIIQIENWSEFELVRLYLGKETEAAQEAAKKALLDENAKLFSGRNSIISYPVNFTPAYCRIVHIGQQCRVIDTGKLYPPEGRLKGPNEVVAGQQAQFELELENERRAQLEAKIFSGRRLVGKQDIGVAYGESWVGLFSVNLSTSGPAIIKVEDQFGNLKASAYVQVVGLSARPIGVKGNRHEFELTFGGRPVEGAVFAWLDDGQKKQVYSSFGKVVVLANPSKPTQTINFEYQGAKATLEYKIEPRGFFESYAKYALPAIALVVGAYLLLRANRKIKYRIVFPETARLPPAMVSVRWKEMEEAYYEADRKNGGHLLTVYPEELAAALAAKKKVAIDQHSLNEVLETLVRKGKMSNYEQAYAPAKILRKLTCGQLHALRILHDAMLENGLRFSRKRNLVGGVEIVLFEGKEKVLVGLGKRRRAVLFESAKQKEDFLESLRQNTEQDVLIKIAIQNRKLFLMAPDKKEIQKVLK